MMDDDDMSQPSLDGGITRRIREQQPKNNSVVVGAAAFVATGSPTSIRDHFTEEIMSVRPIDESPFDEPPIRGGMRGQKKTPHTSSSSSSSSRRRRKYSLDGYSFYQSPQQLRDGYTVDSNRPVSSLVHHHPYSGENEDNESTSSASSSSSSSENSDISSFLTSTYYHQGPACDDDDDDDSRSDGCDGSEVEIGDCHHCDAMVVNVQDILGLRETNYRSKPLPKPIVWKAYTCLRGTSGVAAPPTREAGQEEDVSRNKENKRYNLSLRKHDEKEDWHEKKEGRTTATTTRTSSTNNALSSSEDSTSEITCKEASDDENEEDFFRSKVVQEYLDYAKETAQDFLKKSIFVDDPDVFVGKDVLSEDSDSMTNGSV